MRRLMPFDDDDTRIKETCSARPPFDVFIYAIKFNFIGDHHNFMAFERETTVKE
jgi:hypothetical protein